MAVCSVADDESCSAFSFGSCASTVFILARAAEMRQVTGACSRERATCKGGVTCQCGELEDSLGRTAAVVLLVTAIRKFNAVIEHIITHSVSTSIYIQ